MIMLCLRNLIRQQTQFNRILPRFLSAPARELAEIAGEIERITKLINDHPFPHQPLQPTLRSRIPPHSLSNPFVEKVLGRLFAAHSNGLKALEFFRYSAQHLPDDPSADAFEKTLHILARMRYFDQAWELMEHVKVNHPSLLTLKSMSILLSRVAKFQSYEETLQAFDKMEKAVFVGRKFGTEEFNVLLRAFCTQRMMKEARSVFNKLYSRFSPDIKSANILLLGFKESGDVTSVELFYHEMVRRGFKPNSVTYDIRVDAYSKKGCLGDALRLFEEMEQLQNCKPTVKTITTLIHGAGVAQSPTKAWELFDMILKRNMKPDVGAYNALISSMVKCRDVKAALQLMKEMEEKQIGLDNVTYHTLYLGLMRSKGIEGVCDLYHEMIEKNFVPKTRTVVMLTKFFCVNRQVDLGMHLWGYIIGKGQCPHSHALDLLVTGLCSRGRLLEAFECSKQMMERGRQLLPLQVLCSTPRAFFPSFFLLPGRVVALPRSPPRSPFPVARSSLPAARPSPDAPKPVAVARRPSPVDSTAVLSPFTRHPTLRCSALRRPTLAVARRSPSPVTRRRRQQSPGRRGRGWEREEDAKLTFTIK